MDPISYNSSAQWFDFPVYGALVIDSVSTGRVEPLMAETVTSSDALTWTVKLRANLKFTDGTPFDAAAVKFNWDRIDDPANASANRPQTQALSSVTVVDGTTLRVVLKTANGQWPRTLAGAMSYIGSPAAVKADPNALAQKPIAAGPFILKDRVRDSQTTYVRNPNYFDFPRPYADSVVVRPITDDSQRYNSFHAGEGDVMYTFSVDVVNSAQRDKHQMRLLPPQTSIALMVGVTIPPTDDVSIRTAMAKALDLQFIAKNVYNQDFFPNSIFPSQSPYYDANATQPSVDLAGAQQLVDAYVAKTGKDVNITYTNIAGFPAFLQLAEVIKAQLEKLNKVHVTIESMASAAYVGKLRAGGVQLGQNNITSIEPGIFDTFHTGGAANFDKYSNSVTDAALDRARASIDAPSYINAIKDANKQIVKDLPWIALKLTNAYDIYQNNVNDVQVASDAVPRSDLIWFSR